MRQTTISNVTFGWFTGSPAAFRKVHGSVVVGVSRVATRSTTKLTLAWTVGLLCVAASGALPGGVPGIDSDQNHPREFGFVLHERAELKECPRMQNCTLLSPNRKPGVDALEILNGDSAPGVFGSGNDLLRNVVVNPGSEAPFAPGNFLQPSFGTAGLLGLKLGPQPAMPIAHALDGRAGMGVAVRVGSDVDYPKVAAQKVVYIGGIGGLCITCSGEVEDTVVQNQIRLPLPALKKGYLPWPCQKRDSQAAIRGPNAHNALENAPSKDAVVVRDRSVRPEAPQLGLIELIGGRDLAAASNGGLSRKLKALAGGVVGEIMQGKFLEGLRVPSPPGDPVAASIGLLQCLSQGIELGGRSFEFDLGCQLHNKIIPENVQERKRFLRMAEASGFRAEEA